MNKSIFVQHLIDLWKRKLLAILSLLLLIVALSTFISPYIPVILLLTCLAILIVRDFRFGTISIVVLSFTNILSQEIFESFHLFFVLLGLTIFSLLLAYFRNNTEIKGFNKFNWLFAIFGVWAFASGIIALDHHYWILNVELMLRAFFVFYLVYNSFSTKEELITIFKIIVVCTFLSSFIPFVIAVSGFTQQNLLFLFIQRFSGSVFDPNYFSLTVVATVPLAIVLILIEKRILIKLFWGFLIMFLLFSILLSQSRGGIFAVIIVLFYSLIYLYKRNRKQAVILTIFILLIILALPAVFWCRVQLLINAARGVAKFDFSTVHRLTLFRAALDVFIKNPLFGVGLGNFEALAGRYTPYPMVCHNTYLEVAANLGLLGLIPFSLILYRGFNMLKKPFEKSVTADLVWGIRAGLFGIYIVIFFLSVPFKIEFWILLGLSALLYRHYIQQ